MLGIEMMNKEKRLSSTEAIIVNIASLVGLDPLHLLPIYSASKHAIVGFSRAYSVIRFIHFICEKYMDFHQFLNNL